MPFRILKGRLEALRDLKRPEGLQGPERRSSGYMWILEKKMETSMVYWGYIGVIWGFPPGPCRLVHCQKFCCKDWR